MPPAVSMGGYRFSFSGCGDGVECPFFFFFCFSSVVGRMEMERLFKKKHDLKTGLMHFYCVCLKSFL